MCRWRLGPRYGVVDDDLPRRLQWNTEAMGAPQDHDAQLLSAGGAAAVVIRNKERILGCFCERARQSLESARGEQTPVLIDTLPAFITRIAMALAPAGEDGEKPEYASQNSNIGVQHGNERARFTSYSLSEVMQEYQILREILADILNAEARLEPAQWIAIHRSLDEAMTEAASAFVRVGDDLRDMFTAALTHDFRGPLANAWNYLELVRRESQQADRDEYARRAAHNLRRISHMVSGLLDVSRTRAGERLRIDAREIDPRRLLDEAIADLPVRRRQFIVVDAQSSIHVFWDPEMIRRAVDNLVDNAFKYSTADSTVTVRLIETHGRVHISVHNTGDPIPPEEQSLLFHPYRRAASAERSGKSGWGLGLPQVQSIAEAHGGSVGVESSSAGTTFTLDLLKDARTLPHASPPRDAV